jgi:glycosyltransferase involved in cell wall biosynthesis
MAKYKTRISVIMPCYNAQKYISIAIGSILNQTFSDFELIIINDGSTDNTHLEIKRFIDKRIKYIQFPKNKGNYYARNVGMKRAIGKYISVMDSDDVAYESKLEIQYNYLEKYSKVGAIGSNGVYIDENGVVIGHFQRPQSYHSLKAFFLQNIGITHSTLMLRSSLIHKFQLYYNEEFKYAGDYDFQVRCSKKFEIRNIENNLVQYRVHLDQISKANRLEQDAWAEKVILSQLKEFNIRPTKNEKNLHLMMMKREIYDEKKLQLGVNWFNRLLETNTILKLYDQNHLYQLFEKIIQDNSKISKLSERLIDAEIIDFIKERVSVGSCILELGSGIRTNLLLNHYNVTSVEHNPLFVRKRTNNHRCIYAPINQNWYSKKNIREALKTKFQIIIIDGPMGHLSGGLLRNIDLFFNIQTPLIFDDVNRAYDRAC